MSVAKASRRRVVEAEGKSRVFLTRESRLVGITGSPLRRCKRREMKVAQHEARAGAKSADVCLVCLVCVVR